MIPSTIIVALLVFGVSLYAVMKGADWLIDGASGLALHFRVSEMLIGLTVVAFGTSLPELVVSINAAIKGNPILAYANVIGSNIANILLILGLAAIVSPIMTSNDARKHLPFSFFLVLAFFLLVAVTNFPSDPVLNTTLGRGHGLFLIACFIAFIALITLQERRQRHKSKQPPEEPETAASDQGTKNLGLLTLQVAAGLGLVIVGGDFTVRSAVEIAAQLGVDESTIGLTIVAFGTSLPELVASLMAAGKQKSDIAIGNILGSNIMNLALVLGTTLIASPLVLDQWSSFDFLLQTLVYLALLFLLMRKRGPNISRQIGIIFVICYIAYMALIGLRTQFG